MRVKNSPIYCYGCIRIFLYFYFHFHFHFFFERSDWIQVQKLKFQRGIKKVIDKGWKLIKGERQNGNVINFHELRTKSQSKMMLHFWYASGSLLHALAGSSCSRVMACGVLQREINGMRRFTTQEKWCTLFRKQRRWCARRNDEKFFLRRTLRH